MLCKPSLMDYISISYIVDIKTSNWYRYRLNSRYMCFPHPYIWLRESESDTILIRYKYIYRTYNKPGCNGIWEHGETFPERCNCLPLWLWKAAKMGEDRLEWQNRWLMEQKKKESISYGSLGGLGFFPLSWIVLMVPPIILPPASSKRHTFPNAAFILSFDGSPA